MFRTGLLVLTSPIKQLRASTRQVLEKVSDIVQKTLYVHFQPTVSANIASKKSIFQTAYILPSIDQQNCIVDIYKNSSKILPYLDVKILQGNIVKKELGSQFVIKYPLASEIEVIIFDGSHSTFINNEKDDTAAIIESLRRHLPLIPNPSLKFLDLPLTCDAEDIDIASKTSSSIGSTKVLETESGGVDHPEVDTCQTVCIGGTFDDIHSGHKVLLAEACLRSNERLIVGVTDGDMTEKKTLCELIAPVQDRIWAVRNYLSEIKPNIECCVVPIYDPFGPSIIEPNIQCLVVSEETMKGGNAVNERRVKMGMERVKIHCIGLLDDEQHAPEEEEKISSSSLRRRRLGMLIRPPEAKPNLSNMPYRIGLTGGIASGKSAVAKRLQDLGAAVVDCDKLGHAAYMKGTSTFDKVVAAFGDDIVGDSGEINRAALGARVFSDKKELERLNWIVWPEIARLAEDQVAQHAAAGAEVVVLDAAVLLDVRWESMIHEVWVAIVPKEEAVKRIMDRNHFSEEEAKKRIHSQMTNQQRVDRANVILSTLWDYSITQAQVEKAWTLLQERIHSDPSINQSVIHKV